MKNDRDSRVLCRKFFMCCRKEDVWDYRYCLENVKRGLKDFSAIPDLYVITITNDDFFGEDYMMYTVHNRCVEIPDLEYDDGLRFIYFYTKEQKGGSQAIKNMLTYIQNSDSKNAVDDATRTIDSYVERVKNLPEVETGSMESWKR